MVSVPVPVSVRVTVFAELAVPTDWLLKVRLEADRVTAGALGDVVVVIPSPPQDTSSVIARAVMMDRLNRRMVCFL